MCPSLSDSSSLLVCLLLLHTGGKYYLNHENTNYKIFAKMLESMTNSNGIEESTLVPARKCQFSFWR